MMKKTPIRDLVKDPRWQLLRADLVGTWNGHPYENLVRLRQYLGDFKDQNKLRVVKNYLTGTGFRTGRIHNFPEMCKFRKRISEHLV